MSNLGLFSAPLFAAPVDQEAPPVAAPLPEPLPPAADIDTSADIFARAIVLQLQFRRLGTERKVSRDDIEVKGETAENMTARRLLRVSKSILEAPELDAIARHDGQTARYIEVRKSGPAFANQGGFHLLALDLKPEIDRWLAARLVEREQLIETFVGVYDERRADTARALGPQADDVVWPTIDQVRAAFGVTTRYMQFGYTSEAEAAAWKREALTECRLALREAFAEVVNGLAEKLEPGKDGKTKAVRAEWREKLDAFITSFSARNLADDGELSTLVVQARELMAGVDREQLKKAGPARDRIKSKLGEIRTALDNMIADVPTRRYDADA